MTLWQWMESQAIPGMVLAAWIGAVPFGAVARWIERRVQRRHDERTAALDRLTAALTRPQED